ncbi:hypothetical protein E4U57_001591 [Claviceps arundinis]|uniref:Uncharacterized protein n=1 Tax=Claviceps arundinis TaxID=1623583 RepID=A0ABQ7PKV8_9HYPO|nr:hypothetical protein E4U57_001591 [Claviceps arundinis]
MYDSLGPGSVILEQYYERAYRLWHGLYLAALASPLDHGTALDLQHVFPRHPYFVTGLHLDTRAGNVLYATGTSTWQTSTGGCSLPSFKKRYKVPVTAETSLIVSLPLHRNSFGQDSGHICLLMLAWAYVLSQRWTELVPGAEAIEYTESSAALSLSDSVGGVVQTDDPVVDLGVATDEAVRWWAAVLAPGEGWVARIHHMGEDLRSPWSVSLQSSKNLTLTFRKTLSHEGHRSPPSFSAAVQYIADYAKYHGIEDQSHAAFAAALLLPTRRNISKRLCWSYPDWHTKRREPTVKQEQCGPPWGKDRNQLDKLMTMSCNAIGMLSLLCSSFIDPDLPCNACGAWMQGAFAVIDEPEAQKPDVLRGILVQRSPHLSFLWLGAILLDMQGYIMQRARPVAYFPEFHSASWTGTLISFIQRPIPNYPANMDIIRRADGARLMFLSQTKCHSDLPLVPFPPFGAMPVRDCVLEVQLHASCGGGHGLVYAGWEWDCDGDVKVAQDPGGKPFDFSVANGPAVASMAIRYDKLDPSSDCSEAITLYIFNWLRKDDGGPVGKRGIPGNWIGNHRSRVKSERAVPEPEGHGKSTTSSRRRVGPRVFRALTTQSHSI